MRLPTAAYRLIGRFSTSRLDRWLHPRLYRVTGGRGIAGRVLGAEMLLLTTIGRQSGLARTVVLFAFPVADPPGSWAVIGSRGGSRRIPAWYRNLEAHRDVTIQVRGLVLPARARDAAGGEYEAIFERAATVYPGYRLYRRESPLRIPIVVLEPRPSIEPDLAR
ncbi:MAG: nitroreductase family deazaflavin-dependent oxidoreductase [Chloroflexi bacterium]|nr:nitroreductase family deazaflavin-dependent oxidoreductase [Chloroflexota bacterium]